LGRIDQSLVSSSHSRAVAWQATGSAALAGVAQQSGRLPVVTAGGWSVVTAGRWCVVTAGGWSVVTAGGWSVVTAGGWSVAP
jgi:hypothetical protein